MRRTVTLHFKLEGPNADLLASHRDFTMSEERKW